MKRQVIPFDDYVVARGPALLRFAFLLVRDHHLAEDLVQEALARSHRRWGSIERNDPDSYVRRAVLNAFLSWRRRRSSAEQPVAEVSEGRQPVHADIAGALVERDELAHLLQSLPRQQRAVMVLRYYEDLDDKAIAALLDCSPATVRAHASRALARLRIGRAQDRALNGERS